MIRPVKFSFILMLIGFSIPGRAGDWKHIVQACDNAAKSAGISKGSSIFQLDSASKTALVQKSATRFPWEDCVIKFTGFDWLAPTMGGIAPGSSLGLGLRSQHDFNSGRIQSKVVARGLYSLTNFSMIEGRYDIHMPTFYEWNPATQRQEDQLTISFFARRLDLRTQDFYGLGENSTQSGHALYQLLENEAGFTGYVPVHNLPWLAMGGGLKFISPTVRPRAAAGTPSIEQEYTPAQVPGLLQQPNFLDFQALLRFHTPTAARQTWNRHDLRITYDHFADKGSGTYTFNRVETFATGTYDVRHNISSPFHRTLLQNLLCEPIVGDQCRLGNIVLNGLLTMTSTGAGHAVPFYFQSTLGGADIEGYDTLRGLVDYRLRGPNRMLFQAEFYKGMLGWPIGFYAFFDAGKVALQRSDLDFTNLRHDFGPGIFIRAGGNIVLRAYIGFGAGEGSHPNAKFFNAF